MTKKALALVAVLFVVLSGAGVATAVSPGSTLADDFDSSTTDDTTVVVAVGDPGTEDGRAAMLAANAIAADGNHSVVRVPNSSVPVGTTVRALGQQYNHGDLENAIVVGVGQDNVEGVASAIDQIGDDDGTIAVQDQIYASSASDLLEQATLQTWTSDSSELLVTTSTQSDVTKSVVAYSNDTFAGTPVVAASSGFDSVDALGESLGASTVYVTPGVSDGLRDDLSNDGYTVKTQVEGVTFDQSVEDFSVGLVGNSTEDVAFTSDPTDTLIGSQVGSGGSSGLIVGEGGDSLSSNTSTKFGNLGSLQDVYVLGDESTVSDALLSDISSSAQSSANVSCVTANTDAQLSLRVNFLTSGYNKGVLVSSVDVANDNATVTITNIGYSTVEPLGSDVRALYDETDITTSPSGETVGDRYAVSLSGDIDPTDTREFTITDGSVDKGGHPDDLDYNVRLAGGGSISAGDVFDTFFDGVGGLVDWIKNTVTGLLPGTLNLGAGGVLPLLVGAVAIVAVLAGAFSLVRRRRAD